MKTVFFALAATSCLLLAGCGAESPRTPYEARQQVEQLGASVSQGKETLDKTADVAVTATKEGLTTLGEKVEGAMDTVAPVADAAKEGLTSLGNTLRGAAKELKEGGPPPENVTQPHVTYSPA